MTFVTPIKQTPLNDLRQVVEICVCYGDEKNIAATDAQRQLPRIQALILAALAKLEEPHQYTVEAVLKLVGMGDIKFTEREARDIAAVITHNALTWGLGDDL